MLRLIMKNCSWRLLDVFQMIIDDTCNYISDRWNNNNYFKKNEL